MAHIAIPIPSLPGKQDIEIDVTINGQKQALHYRVELLYWDDCQTSPITPIMPDQALNDQVMTVGKDPVGRESTWVPLDRAECIRKHLANYDQDWTLYFIGAPTDAFVPVTFVRKEDLVLQRRLLTGSV